MRNKALLLLLPFQPIPKTVSDFWPIFNFLKPSWESTHCHTVRPSGFLSHQSFTLYVHINYSDNVFVLSALIDSGLAGTFMDHKTALKLNLPTKPLEHPLQISAMDGEPSEMVPSFTALNPSCPGQHAFSGVTTNTNTSPGCTFITLKFPDEDFSMDKASNLPPNSTYDGANKLIMIPCNHIYSLNLHWQLRAKPDHSEHTNTLSLWSPLPLCASDKQISGRQHLAPPVTLSTVQCHMSPHVPPW